MRYGRARWVDPDLSPAMKDLVARLVKAKVIKKKEIHKTTESLVTFVSGRTTVFVQEKVNELTGRKCFVVTKARAAYSADKAVELVTGRIGKK